MTYMTTPEERRFRLIEIAERQLGDEVGEQALAEVLGRVDVSEEAEDELTPRGVEVLAEIRRAIYPSPPRFKLGQHVYLASNDRPDDGGPPYAEISDRQFGPDGWLYILKDPTYGESDQLDEEKIRAA